MSGPGRSAPDYAGHSGAYTPGPWRSYRDRVYAAREDASDFWVAYCDSPYVRDASANAHLIAAAPELLEALKQAYDDLVLCRTDNAMQIINAAIAKAEGRQL